MANGVEGASEPLPPMVQEGARVENLLRIQKRGYTNFAYIVFLQVQLLTESEGKNIAKVYVYFLDPVCILYYIILLYISIKVMVCKCSSCYVGCAIIIMIRCYVYTEGLN